VKAVGPLALTWVVPRIAPNSLEMIFVGLFLDP